MDLRQAADALVCEEEAGKLLTQSEIRVTGMWDTQDCKFFMRVEPGDTCRLFLLCDTGYLPLPTMEAVLRGIEAIVFQAAYRSLAVADIPALTGLGHGSRGSRSRDDVTSSRSGPPRCDIVASGPGDGDTVVANGALARQERE
jgi:hypothetical protein